MPYIPVTMPVQFADTIKNWSADEKVANVSSVIAVLKDTWNLQTFENLQQGKVAVGDEVINRSLAAALEGSTQIKELTVASQENHTLKITALTSEVGHVVMVCRIEQFQQDKDSSFIKLKVLDKKLPDKPFVSWIFSRVSLAMVTKLVGKVEPGHGLNVQIEGNYVTVDFHQALLMSPLGNSKLFGYKPLEALTITEAVPEKGYVVFKTAVDMPEGVSAMIKNVLE